MMITDMLFSRCISKRKMDIIAIIVGCCHRTDRWMGLVSICRYILVMRSIILDGITKGSLKKVGGMDKDIW